MAVPKLKIGVERSPVNEGDLQKSFEYELESLPWCVERVFQRISPLFLSVMALLLLAISGCSSATGSDNTAGCESDGLSCGLSQSCDDDQGCVPLLLCGPETCDGCCVNNQCIRPGNSDNACGMGGDPCLNCERAGSSCQGTSCGQRCDSSNCTGCCDVVTGQCLNFAQQVSEGVCGEGGGGCTRCGSGRRCSEGECVEDLCEKSDARDLQEI